MKYLVLLVFFSIFYAQGTSAQVEVSVKSGVQMLGMFRSSSNVFGDGAKTLNPSYGLRISHKLTNKINISMDGGFTSGNYHNLKELNPSNNPRFWQTVDYSLINTAVLFTYKIGSKIGLKSGFHFFFVGKINESAPSKPVTGGCLFTTRAHENSRALGIPVGISFFLLDNFEFEVKWVGTLSEFTDGDRAYRRLESVSFNLFYTFKRKEQK